MFFVTAREGKEYFVMSGPYETHQEALDAVSMARDTASDIDGRAWFMAWGTAHIPGRTQPGNLERCHLV